VPSTCLGAEALDPVEELLEPEFERAAFDLVVPQVLTDVSARWG
jgi:hypothetical protein